LSSKEIGEALSIAKRTTDEHLSSAIDKLNAQPHARGGDCRRFRALFVSDAAFDWCFPATSVWRPIDAVLEVLQSEKGKKGIRNDRLIAVPRVSHRAQADKNALALPKQVRKEIEKFFVATDELEDKQLQFLNCWAA
jgi:inorganic pyrophosphatase